MYGASTNFKRQRGEKKPIPDEQKDDKYFERRRRNNQAAKKSRDARKMREDQVNGCDYSIYLGFKILNIKGAKVLLFYPFFSSL